MKRRALLKKVGIGIAGLGAGLFSTAADAAWGDQPTGFWPAGSSPVRSILEIYLWGGMAPWETFYYRPVGGTTRGFDTDVSTLTWNGACPGTPAGLVSQLLDNDSAGKAVHLGPFAKPLWRADILARLRVIVMQHDVPVHEFAIPYALGGRRLGKPGACGLGAPMQRRARVLDPMNTHPLPFSYCMLPDAAIGSAFFNVVDAVGDHPGNSKPVIIPIGLGTAAFVANLNRAVGAGADPVLTQYRAQYAARLVPSGATGRARSEAFSDYDSSVSSLFAAPSLAGLLGLAPLTAGAAQFCSSDTGATFQSGQHFAGTALQAAAFLLNNPTPAQKANYVCVVDGGLNNLGFAYDVHNTHQAQRTSSNIWETLAALASIIRVPADPPDPLKIDLNDTMVLIRTEFGRTPYRSLGGTVNATSNGRDHWPDAYVSVLIGGPIQTKGVVGSIADGTPASGTGTGEGKAEAGMNYKPQDIQAAALLAAGIDPFADGNLPVGDLTPSLFAATHLQASINIRQTILGVP